MLSLVLAVVAALVIGRVLTARQGKVRDVAAEQGDDLRPLVVEAGGVPGERATLLQFSSAFCAPCRATRSVLSRVADSVPGVAHVEVDAEAHLELVRRLDVRSTPTTLVLDATGREVRRATGAPTPTAVLQALPS